jgi:hypothetical protein
MKTRSLKIENCGDFFRRKTYPKIRLQGQWLAKLGFNPESRVLVVPGQPGEITLRVQQPEAAI